MTVERNGTGQARVRRWPRRRTVLFGAAIAFVCSYEGFVTEAGAEGVGRSTAKAVVITSVTILILDTLTAALLAPYLQT